MFRKAYEWQLCGEDTLKLVRAVKQLPVSNNRARYLTVDEIPELIKSCEPHLQPIVQLAINTGMRRGEILSLQWEQNIDLRHGYITLDKSKNGEGRTIPINDTLRGVLQSLTRRLDVPYVFFDPETGKPYKTLKRSFRTALRRAGIRNAVFHTLRHTFASHLVMSGVDITTVSKLLGHKSLQMTLRYSHLAPNHIKNAVNILDSTINQKPTIQKLYNSTKKELAVND